MIGWLFFVILASLFIGYSIGKDVQQTRVLREIAANIKLIDGPEPMFDRPVANWIRNWIIRNTPTSIVWEEEDNTCPACGQKDPE
jgi:hypothetical protein